MTTNSADRSKTVRASSAATNVLFVCIGNACRSPMAESIAREVGHGLIHSTSAGLRPLGFLPELTTRTLLANGYSIEELHSKAISREAWAAADIVINMSGTPREEAFTDFTKVEDWPVRDPFGADPEVYQAICEDIQARVEQLAGRLRHPEPTSCRE